MTSSVSPSRSPPQSLGVRSEVGKARPQGAAPLSQGGEPPFRGRKGPIVFLTKISNKSNEIPRTSAEPSNLADEFSSLAGELSSPVRERLSSPREFSNLLRERLSFSREFSSLSREHLSLPREVSTLPPGNPPRASFAPLFTFSPSSLLPFNPHRSSRARRCPFIVAPGGAGIYP
jgi:hypothetical protein